MRTIHSANIILWRHNEINKAMKSPEVFVMILIIVLLYIVVSEDDAIVQPYITIQNKCEMALRNQHDIPKYVIEQCKKLLKEDDDE